VYLLGDSTVCDQPLEPYASWGQMLPRFFRPGVAIANHAESGESLRGSRGARRLDKVLSVLRPGDYLFLQFGHNDMKSVSAADYKAELKRYAAAAKLFDNALDAIPRCRHYDRFVHAKTLYGVATLAVGLLLNTRQQPGIARARSTQASAPRKIETNSGLGPQSARRSISTAISDKVPVLRAMLVVARSLWRPSLFLGSLTQPLCSPAVPIAQQPGQPSRHTRTPRCYGFELGLAVSVSVSTAAAGETAFFRA